MTAVEILTEAISAAVAIEKKIVEATFTDLNILQ